MMRSAFRLVSHSDAIDALLLMAHPSRSAKWSGMKHRYKRILVVLGFGLVAYFASYFMSVRIDKFESHDQIVPTPYYRPFDVDFLRAAFGPAHLIDATYIRPAHWEPRSVERNHVR